MIPPVDPTTLPLPAQKILGEGAPPKLRLMAAKGIVPGIRPDALLAVIVALAAGSDAEAAAQAQQTLAQLPEPVLTGALDADLPEAVLYTLCQYYTDRLDVLERVIRMPRLPIEAVELLAEHGADPTIELVAVNEELLLKHPRVIALIYMNKRSRMSTANRLIELAVRNGVEVSGIPAWKEVSQSISGELIAEPSGEPLPEDQFFWDQQKLAEELTDDRQDDEIAFVENDEGEEKLVDKFKPLYQRIADMSVPEKIRRAMLGTKEERALLVREQNKVVASAAARSPMLQEPEVIAISRNRGVIDDVLRIIAMSPEWMKSYQVRRNLVTNAKTPVAISTRLIPHMRESDLRKLQRDRNVASPVRQAARRHLDRRKR
jgi:hypothetical protein